MGRTEASAVYRCTVLLGRLLFRKFLMSSRASQSMSSHSEYLSCRSLSCRQGETNQSNYMAKRTNCITHNVLRRSWTSYITRKCCRLACLSPLCLHPENHSAIKREKQSWVWCWSHWKYLRLSVLPLISVLSGSHGRHSGAGSAPHSHGWARGTERIKLKEVYCDLTLVYFAWRICVFVYVFPLTALQRACRSTIWASSELISSCCRTESSTFRASSSDKSTTCLLTDAENTQIR